MGKFESFDELLFGDLICRAFDHHHFLFVTYVDEVEFRFEDLLIRWVYDKCFVDQANAHAADRTVPWHIRNHEGGRSAIYHEDVWLVNEVRLKQHTDDLDFVHETLRKEWAKRTVAEARCEDFLFGRTSFTLDVSAWETPCGRELLAVIYCKRKKVLTFADVARCGRADEDCGLSLFDGVCTGGEVGQCARGYFDSEFLNEDVVFLFHIICSRDHLNRETKHSAYFRS